MALENKVTFKIAGLAYSVSTDEDPEYVKALADSLDARITALGRRGGMSLVQSTTMAALEVLDQVNKQKKENEALKAQLKTCLEDSAKAKSERDRLKRELGSKNGNQNKASS